MQFFERNIISILNINILYMVLFRQNREHKYDSQILKVRILSRSLDLMFRTVLWGGGVCIVGTR